LSWYVTPARCSTRSTADGALSNCDRRLEVLAELLAGDDLVGGGFDEVFRTPGRFAVRFVFRMTQVLSNLPANRKRRSSPTLADAS